MQETCNLCPWHGNDNLENLVYRAEHHSLFFPKVPMVYREDGGHLILLPHRHVVDRRDFSGGEALEYMRFSMIVSDVMYTALPSFGIDIGRINYHDNGNLEADKKIGAHQHLHFFGRARGACHQKWKENLCFPMFDPTLPYYSNSTHFNDQEKKLLRQRISEAFDAGRFLLSEV